MFGNIAFLLETVLQVSDKYSAMFSPRTGKVFFINGALVLKIYSACSFVDAMFSSGNFFCFASFARAQSTSEGKSAYFFVFHKFLYKKLWLFLGKIGRPVCVFLMKNKIATLKVYPHFWNILLIFMIF